MTANASSCKKHVPALQFFYTLNIFCNREFGILQIMTTNDSYLIYTLYEILLVANKIGFYGKKVPQELTIKIQSVRRLYTINKIYRVKAISTLDYGIISPSFPCCKSFLIVNM